MTPADFRRRLRAARRRAGHTQASVARVLGVRPNTVARWERGLSTPPREADIPLSRERALARVEALALPT